MIRANEWGFLPGKSGVENARALQKAVDNGGTIIVEQPGVYDIAETVEIGDDTELVFLAGAYVKRGLDEDGVHSLGYVFVNKGAYTRSWNKHITIRGMKLICGENKDARKCCDIVGLIGHLSFYYVKHLVIDDFECMDLGKENFCIQICTFEDIRVENVHIEGNKDGVHLGRGKRFTIRNGVFRTFDDPIALNAHDYATSNPQLGWIEDGLIENCYDLDQENTTGYFCRILAGSWVDWFEGMRVQHSDTVVAHGRLYRVCMKPDWTEYVSHTCPSHEDGAQVLDGINWVMIQDDKPIYNCGCRNVHFKDIFLKKRRPTGFSIHFDHDNWSRSVYPGSKAPVQENLIFENVCVENEVPVFFRTITPVDCVKVINSSMGNSMIAFHYLPEGTVEYPTAHVLMAGTTFKHKGEQLVVKCSKGCSGTLKILGSIAEDENFCAKVKGDVRVISSDVPVKTEN